MELIKLKKEIDKIKKQNKAILKGKKRNSKRRIRSVWNNKSNCNRSIRRNRIKNKKVRNNRKNEIKENLRQKS